MPVGKMFDLFKATDSLIVEISCGDLQKKNRLDLFCFRLFCLLDGVEMPWDSWRGIALVAREDLPDEVDEINDDFLHDAWRHRHDVPNG